MKETITSLQNKIVKEVYSLKDNKNIKLYSLKLKCYNTNDGEQNNGNRSRK